MGKGVPVPHCAGAEGGSVVFSIGVRYCDAVAFFVSGLVVVANWSKVIWALDQH